MRQYVVLTFFCVSTSSVLSADEPPTIPVGLDSYHMWEKWPYQRIGARAYMRSTYDRHGGNESADASHFLYQEADDFNVTLDLEGPGILYFARYNRWHGSPWHYEVDGVDHIIRETSSSDPTKPVSHSVYLPKDALPNPLTWTWSDTKGADLMWVPVPFQRSFRMAYSRTHYGTGYYIYHQFLPDAKLTRRIAGWDGKTPPDPGVLELLNRAGTDIAPKDIQRTTQTVRLDRTGTVSLCTLRTGPTMIRALKLSVPRHKAVAFGQARLRITWDDRAHPSVDAPVCLFFGAGTLYNRDDREYLVKAFPTNIRYTKDRAWLACYFPMPFFKTARIELANVKAEWNADVELEVRWMPCTDPPNHVGYFHATYRDHHEPELGKDLVLLDTREAEGSREWSGSFVGTSFIFSRRAYLPTLEGDPRFFFDDSKTPQAYGTGTEEWGGGGDYWGGRNMTLPLAGHPVGARSAKEAKNNEDLIQSAYRFLLADLMPFGKNAVIRLEHGGRNQSKEHYQTVTYWYGLPSPSLVKTDEINVGDLQNERVHDYFSPEASEPVSIISRYELGVDSIRITADSGPLAYPQSYAEFEFEADARKTYFIWARGRALGNDIRSDAFWIQFDSEIGTTNLRASLSNTYGVGNWLDAARSQTFSWSSGRPQDRPLTVTFARSGKHRLRIQPRNGAHRLDQLWLSTRQITRPKRTDVVQKPTQTKSGSNEEIVLNASDARVLKGGVTCVEDGGASIRQALHLGGEEKTIEVLPAHEEVGRYTRGTSEFTVKLLPDNRGVLLRRTLDYSFPNQRAEVFVADASNGQAGGDLKWEYAGAWYLAGSNTCVYSNPRGELGKTLHIVQTSNRRFRDDEFLVAAKLTAGRKAIRVRVRFTPVKRPLFPGHPIPELAWSELRYSVYCYVMPKSPVNK